LQAAVEIQNLDAVAAARKNAAQQILIAEQLRTRCGEFAFHGIQGSILAQAASRP
jgi:hypothetical protein